MAAENDQNRIDGILESNYKRLYAYCLAKLKGDGQAASDCLFDVFEAARSHADILADHPEPVGWLFVTAKNIIKNHIRKQQMYKKRFPLFEPEKIQLAAERLSSRTLEGQPDMEAEPSDEEILKIREELLNSLPQQERELFTARFEEHVPLSELAERYGISKEAIGMRLSRISAKLREKARIYFQNDR